MNITTELGTNILHHSEGNGYVTIQLYKTSNKIRIALPMMEWVLYKNLKLRKIPSLLNTRF